MDMPNRLYRYRAANLQDLTSLASAKLWFSSPKKFNDPFDCAYSITIPTLAREECIALLERISPGYYKRARLSRVTDEVLRDQVSSGLNQAVNKSLTAVGGVCCFCAVNDNLLLWGHYADGHRGICLEFDTSAEPMFQKAKEVKYSRSLPQLTKDAFLKHEFSQVLALLLTKSADWEYEREWRILHGKGDFSYSYNRACLTAVYCGAKMSEDQMLMIASMLSRTDTKLFRMRMSESEFKLVAEPFTFTPIDYRKSSETAPVTQSGRGVEPA